MRASELSSLLKRHGLRLRKRLGQHYLAEPGTIARILSKIPLAPGATVIEVGAGLGALTEPLAARGARVLAVEIDPGIARVLAERLRAVPGVRVVTADILEFDWRAHQPAAVVGAIPYHITGPFVAKLCGSRDGVLGAWLVVQLEVARRLTARPGSREYGRLSILAQYAWETALLLRVPRGAFFPPPKVESALVGFRPRTAAVSPGEEESFLALVKAAFAHRRKTLANCLSDPKTGIAPRARVEAALEARGLARNIRAERVAIEDFAGLTRTLH
ncbi:MAG TPA: 16S rRNA (adenine(1518)-N(6)/adenine(1519)-N(6))-dimethyltransferase RsmA [bacterium]